MLVVITSGDCTVTSDTAKVHASTGSMLFLSERQAFDLCSQDGMSAYWFRFSLEGFHPHASTPRPMIDAHVKLQPSMIQSTVTTAKQLLEHWRQPGVASSFHCQAGMFQLLGDYLEIYLEGRETTRGSQESLCIRVKRFIEGQLSETITLDEISQHIGLTPTHIQKVFKEVMGVTPHQYQTHLRMYKAKQLLSLQDVTLKEIAVKVGFKSTEAFSRAFRREVGCSPGEYRGGVGGV